jgi:hypothetical protein
LFARIYTEDGVNRRIDLDEDEEPELVEYPLPVIHYPNAPERKALYGNSELDVLEYHVVGAGGASPASAIGAPKLGSWPLTCCFVVEGSPTPGQSGSTRLSVVGDL